MGSTLGSDIRLTVGTYRPLIRVRGSHSVPLVPLGPVFTWLVHWSAQDLRTMPCLMSGCTHCADFCSRRPMSYLAVAQYTHRSEGPAWTPAILEVPLTTGLELLDHSGRPVGLKRITPKGRVIIGTFQPSIPLPLFKAFDILPSLARMWRLEPGQQLRLLDPAQLSMWNVAGD